LPFIVPVGLDNECFLLLDLTTDFSGVFFKLFLGCSGGFLLFTFSLLLFFTNYTGGLSGSLFLKFFFFLNLTL